MRIAIDLTSTPKSKTGIGRYMLGLLKGLQENDKENEYFLFAQDDDLDGFGITEPNFHMIPVKSSILRKQYIRILWEQIVFPFRLKKLNIDVLHCPNYTMPYTSRLIDKKMAVSVIFHDMTYFCLPECHVGWKREMFKWYIKRTARACDKIVTDSVNSQIDIPKYCKPKNPDVDVTYMGVKEEFFQDGFADKELLEKYKIDSTGDYILYVGTLEPRKNIPGLIEGYKLLDKSIKDKTQLVIVGKKGWMFDEIFSKVQADEELKSRVVFTGFVPDDEMRLLMKSAKTFAYVSLYEGFGMPVIEGMASRVPVVTSTGSSLGEIAEGYGFLCDPRNNESIKDCLNDALNLAQEAQDGDLEANNKLDSARSHAAEYTWNRCAEVTIKGFDDAVKFRSNK